MRLATKPISCGSVALESPPRTISFPARLTKRRGATGDFPALPRHKVWFEKALNSMAGLGDFVGNRSRISPL